MSEYQSTFSIPGIASQIDWGAMADKLLENARKPITQWTAKQDTLELKIGLFEEFSANLKSLRSVVSPLKLESVFKAKMAEFSVLSGVNANSVVTATVDASASIAQHEIEIVKKAVAETRFSSQITTTMGEAVPPLSGTKKFSINVGGRRADIEVLTSDTLLTIAQKINASKDATIDPATGYAYGDGLGVTATVMDNKLVIKSSNTGIQETTTDWKVTRGTGEKDRLGFTVVKEAPSTGSYIITNGTNVYEEGVHFNILSGSDEISWKVGIDNPPVLPAPPMPGAGTVYNVSYKVKSNPFTITGESEIVDLLKLNDFDPEYNIKAEDAELKVDGLDITRSSNTIDDLITGVKLTINGAGKVVMDITQDAEKAVTGVQDFVEYYNDALDWINIRLSESRQDKSLDVSKSDDFAKKFGLLHGNSMLWQSKSQLRMLMTNPVEAKYTAKTGSAVLGTMASQGLTSTSTFELTVGVRTAKIEVTPSDTLSTIASKINTSYEMLHDAQGRTYPIPMASAKVVNNQLVIEASSGRKFSLAAQDNVLESLGLGTPFTLLSQLGISTESADYGKSGKLAFDTDKFMEALSKDPDGVAAIMGTVMTSMDEYIGGMVDATQVQVGDSTAPKGRIASQIYTFRSEITTINKRISDFERRLEVRARGLYESFAQAEVRLAKLQQQAGWLSSVVSQMNGGGG